MLNSYKTWIIASAVTFAVSMNVATLQAEEVAAEESTAVSEKKQAGQRGKRMQRIETKLNKILARIKKIMAHHDIAVDDAEAPVQPEPGEEADDAEAPEAPVQPEPGDDADDAEAPVQPAPSEEAPAEG